jgi:hypothetical protein
MTHKQTIRLIAAVVLGAGIGAALANQSATNAQTTSDTNSANALVDTSGVCISDYCGCFEDLSRSRMLTDPSKASVAH